MTELDPSLVLKAFATPQTDVARLLETRQQLKLRNLAQAKLERQESDAQAAQERRQSIGARYATDPTGARQEALSVGDFELVKSLDQMDEATRKRVTEISRATAPMLMSLKQIAPEERAGVLQAMAPQLAERGFGENQLAQLLQGDLSDRVLDGIGNSAMTIEEYTKANEPYTLVPGAGRFVGGKLIAERPFAPRTVTVTNADGGEEVIEYLPGGGASSGAGGGPLTLEGVRPHIVAQESSGNYSARNRETGAMGAYQVMPATGRALAERLGVPWRPQLMTSSTAEGKAYQDAIGGAAIQEAIDASGGDPVTMAQYYHGGSDRKIWGPKTQQYGQEVAARIGGGQGPRVVATGAPKRAAPPSGFRWSADGKSLEAIPGGPAASGGAGGTPNRKGEADLRKEFNQRPEVKDFRAKRTAWQTIDRLGKQTPTAQNDMALIFQFMKMLDPGSVVREGEFANAQNAAGVPDRIVNAYNKARSGELMNPDQRRNMINSAATNYTASRDIYNPVAAEFQGYARDYGLDPNRVAQEYRQTRGGAQVTSGGWGKAQVVQ